MGATITMHEGTVSLMDKSFTTMFVSMKIQCQITTVNP